ncbi:MAG: glycosyltransferase [Agriterribacter sp.]
MNVLFLLMEFAPVNTTGNFRSLKFVKYLREFGVNPIVVTLNEAQAADIFDAKVNYDLLNDLPPDTVIYRVSCDPIIKKRGNKLQAFLDIYFNLVDKIGEAWKQTLFKELPIIINKHKPELIYTSLPPFSCGLLAVEVSKKFGIPLVVDMRDLWSYWGSNPHGSYFHFAAKKVLERQVFNHAVKIIGVTPQLLEIFKRTHPKISQTKFAWISNGYDNSLELPVGNSTSASTTKFTIGYVGSFYYDPESNNSALLPWWKRKGHRKLQYFPTREDWLYRSPYFFFRALYELFRLSPELKSRIRFEYIGKEPIWLNGMLEEFDLKDIFYSHGFRTHSETLKIQDSFDAFLATAEKVDGAEHYCLPSKIFDYVQKGKPILAFVTSGVQKDFLLKSEVGIYCDPDNASESALKIRNVVQNVQTIRPNHSYLLQYQRKYLTGKLASIFKSL